jgi:hypothetical protein
MPGHVITQAELKESLHYDPLSGLFTWIIEKQSYGGKVKIGQVAGTLSCRGYIHIGINQKIYRAHRLVFLYVNGCFPDCDVDHINGVRDDNRLSNLRLAYNNHLDNMQNTCMHSRNTSGYTGVTYMRTGGKRIKRWMAQIFSNKKRYHLGYFHTKEEAYSAYLQAKEHIHLFQPAPREIL